MPQSPNTPPEIDPPEEPREDGRRRRRRRVDDADAAAVDAAMEQSAQAAPSNGWGMENDDEEGGIDEWKLGLVLAVVLLLGFGVVLWRKYQRNSSEPAVADAFDGKTFEANVPDGSSGGLELAPPETPRVTAFADAVSETTPDVPEPAAEATFAFDPLPRTEPETPSGGWASAETPAGNDPFANDFASADAGPTATPPPLQDEPEGVVDLFAMGERTPEPEEPEVVFDLMPSAPEPNQSAPAVAMTDDPFVLDASNSDTPTEMPSEAVSNSAAESPFTLDLAANSEPTVQPTAAQQTEFDELSPTFAGEGAMPSPVPAPADPIPANDPFSIPIETAATAGPQDNRPAEPIPVAPIPVEPTPSNLTVDDPFAIEMPREDIATPQEAAPRQPAEPAQQPGFVFEAPSRQPVVAEVVDLSGRANGLRTHTVREGENFWTISKAKYGTVRYFGALAYYNRDRVPDPKKMRPGDDLVLPPSSELDAIVRKFGGSVAPARALGAVAATTAPARPTGAGDHGRDGYFLRQDGTPCYRVRSDDTLGGIARNMLGRASRWRQIHAMNRNTITDPDRLTPGVVLILPHDAAAIQQARR